VNFFLPFVRSSFLYFLLRFRNRIHHREVEMQLYRPACSPVAGCQSNDNKNNLNFENIFLANVYEETVEIFALSQK
jgi:hypothetical protein